MTHDLIRTTVSVFNGVHPSPVGCLPFTEVLATIKSDTHRNAIAQCRTALTQHGQDAYTHYKKQLPSFTPCGVFLPTRAKEHLHTPSGILHLDIDHLNNPQHTKQTLLCGEGVAYVFLSPSGKGVKLGIRIAPVADDASYKHAWHYITTMLQTSYGVLADPSGKDICRLCFVSHDPAIFINLHAKVVPIPAPAPGPMPLVLPPSHNFAPYPDRQERYLHTALRNAEALLDRSQDGTRHAARLKAGRLLGGYVPEFLSLDAAFQLLEAAVLRNTRTPAQALQTLRHAIAYGAQHPITLAQLEAERRAWKGVQG